MGIVGRFERSLQGAVGDAFARLFGGEVVAAEIEASLRKRAESSLRTIDGHQLVSNSYTVTLGRSDHASFTEDERLAVKTFSRHLADHIAEQGWETYGPVAVGFAVRDDLHTGQFRVDGAVDPDAVPFHVSAAAPAPSPGHAVPGPPRPHSPGPGPGGPPQEAPVQPMVPGDRPAPDRNYPVGERTPGWSGSPAPTQITQGRSSRSVTLVLEDGSGRTYPLARGSNVLGRGQDAHFRLPDTGVSRQHADIHFDGREAVLTDLGSTNGTSVNGGPVRDWQLADGDVITIGHSEIHVRVD